MLEEHAARQDQSAPKSVHEALRRKADRLKEDPQTGTYVSPSRVPKSTKRRWERRVGPVTNLYKLDLPRAWRVLYTVGSEGADRAVLILEIVNHTEYERLLGYR